MRTFLRNPAIVAASLLGAASLVTASIALAKPRSTGSQQKAKAACENQLFNDMGACDQLPAGTGYNSKGACQTRARSAYNQCLQAAGISVANNSARTHASNVSNNFGNATPTPTPARIKSTSTSSAASKMNGREASPTPSHKRNK